MMMRDLGKCMVKGLFAIAISTLLKTWLSYIA